MLNSSQADELGLSKYMFSVKKIETQKSSKKIDISTPNPKPTKSFLEKINYEEPNLVKESKNITYSKNFNIKSNNPNSYAVAKIKAISKVSTLYKKSKKDDKPKDDLNAISGFLTLLDYPYKKNTDQNDLSPSKISSPFIKACDGSKDNISTVVSSPVIRKSAILSSKDN